MCKRLDTDPKRQAAAMYCTWCTQRQDSWVRGATKISIIQCMFGVLQRVWHHIAEDKRVIGRSSMSCMYWQGLPFHISSQVAAKIGDAQFAIHPGQV